jgi:hypothetical protein
MSTNAPNLLNFLMGVLPAHVPTLVVALFGCGCVLARPSQSGASRGLAIAGFGLAALLSIVSPIVLFVMQQAVFFHPDRASRMWMHYSWVLVASILHAATYGLLLAALLARRPAGDDTPR